MSKILSRDEFGIELTKYRQGEEINEGLFQFLKSFFKEDWSTIKSKSSEIKNKMQDVDKGLDGFTLLKRSNFDACNQYRQALCDFMNDTLEYELDKLEKLQKEKKKNVLKKVLMLKKDKKEKDNNDFEADDNIESLLGKGSCKDKAMNDKLKNDADAYNEVIKKNPAIVPWANALSRGIKNYINDIIIAKSDADEDEIKKYQEEIEKEEKADKDAIDKQNKDATSEQNDDMKALEKQRQDVLTDAGATEILKGLDGTKAITQLKGEFDKLVKPLLSTKSGSSSTSESLIYDDMYDEYLTEGRQINKKLINYFNADKHFGFKKIIEVLSDDSSVDFLSLGKEDYEQKDGESDRKFTTRITKRVIQIYLKELNALYDGIEEFSKQDKLKDVQCDAIQAMFMGLALGVGYGFVGDHDKKNFFISDENLDIMARCCIASDATIGYSFPLVDDKKPDDGTVFQYLLGQLQKEENKNKVFSTKYDTKLLSDFKKNMGRLYKLIISKATKLKKNAEKEQEKKLKEAEAEKEKEQED